MTAASSKEAVAPVATTITDLSDDADVCRIFFSVLSMQFCFIDFIHRLGWSLSDVDEHWLRLAMIYFVMHQMQIHNRKWNHHRRCFCLFVVFLKNWQYLVVRIALHHQAMANLTNLKLQEVNSLLSVFRILKSNLTNTRVQKRRDGRHCLLLLVHHWRI